MTMNGTRKVQYYGTILEALQRAVPSSVHIAGGAVRDTILDRPIRDVDIFLSNTDADPAAVLSGPSSATSRWESGNSTWGSRTPC